LLASDSISDTVVVSDLWTENSGLEEPLIPESMSAAFVYLLVMDLQNFAYG
jgi:hypothetical protein